MGYRVKRRLEEHFQILEVPRKCVKCVPSVHEPTISRPSSFFTNNILGRYHWRLLIMALSLFHMAEAYISVSMNNICKHTPATPLKLSPETAISLQLDASSKMHSSCRVEFIAPETHSISLLFTRRKPLGEKKTDLTTNEDSRPPKCPLVVSFPTLKPEEIKMCLDLCSEVAFKSVEDVTDLLPPRVTLDWISNAENSSEILASQIVVAAVGRGKACSRPGMFSCRSIGYPVLCISKELVCDGKKNCPFEGRDEDKEMCSSEDNYDKVGLGLGDNSHIGRGWEFLASEFLKKLSSKENLHLRKTDSSSSTEKSTVVWSDDGPSHSRESESLPDVLNHYGPWGYLMLGMLICGTVLMFCGLWECCCRRPKALVSNAVGPALLIINQGAQQNDLETPPTPGPPRYEELDQPPSYSALFPSSKPPDIHSVTGTTNSLPITLPIVNSLTNLRTNTSSSQLNSSPNFQNSRNVNGTVPPPDVFTIDVQNMNSLDISRDMNEPSPK